MAELFTAVVEMSLKAVPVICVLFIFRLLLRKAPKKYSYVLWAVALFRLLCPVSVSSVFSLFNLRVDKVPSLYIPTQTAPTVSGVSEEIPVEQAVIPDRGVPVEQVVVDPPVVEAASLDWEWILSLLWILGVVAVLGYTLWRVVRLYRRTDGAIRLEDNVWSCDRIPGPFVLGLIRPRIFLPAWLGEGERDYVLAHERFHIRRLDPWVKALSQLTLALHWFNPMVWLMLWALDRDMEMSCDEGVLKGTDEAYRKDYSRTLLALGTARREFGPVLAFGTPAVKRRILNVLQWKRATKITVVFAVAILMVAGLTCCTDASSDWEASYAERLYEAKTEYVGDNSAVSNLVDVVLSETLYRYGSAEADYGYPYQSIALETDREPYGMTIFVYQQELGLLEREDAFRTAVLMLTLVDNLSRCTVQLPLITERVFMTVTVEQAEAILNIKDLKSYCSGERKIETLLALIGALEKDAIPAYEAEQTGAANTHISSQWDDLARLLREQSPAGLADDWVLAEIIDCVADGPVEWHGTGMYASVGLSDRINGSEAMDSLYRAGAIMLAVDDEMDRVVLSVKTDGDASQYPVHLGLNVDGVERDLGITDLKNKGKSPDGLADLAEKIEAYLSSPDRATEYGFEADGDRFWIVTGLEAEIVTFYAAPMIPGHCSLYYVNPEFLGDWFGSKVIEGDARWADEEHTILEFGFTMADPDVISEGAVTGPSAVFTVNTVSGKLLSVEIDQQDYQAKIDLTEEEIREAGFILAELMWKGSSLLSGQ